MPNCIYILSRWIKTDKNGHEKAPDHNIRGHRDSSKYNFIKMHNYELMMPVNR